MITPYVFPDFAHWEGTKATLHAYSKVIGAIPRAHAVFHPKWWHISLKLAPDGLVTDTMALPEGGLFAMKINFHVHEVQLITGTGIWQAWSMQDGLTANLLAEHVLRAVADLGLRGDYARQKFESDAPRPYDPAQAKIYFDALGKVEQIFKKHQATLPGAVGPIQLWPHGFDLAFEWFGTRQIESEEHGQTTTFPAQINLGFSPGEPTHPQPYFYSNPFPFSHTALVSHPLPHGARWFTESWNGSQLAYASLIGDPDAEQKILAYAKTVFDLASPGLMA